MRYTNQRILYYTLNVNCLNDNYCLNVLQAFLLMTMIHEIIYDNTEHALRDQHQFLHNISVYLMTARAFEHILQSITYYTIRHIYACLKAKKMASLV